jgi:hypothetical protein
MKASKKDLSPAYKNCSTQDIYQSLEKEMNSFKYKQQLTSFINGK